MRTFLRRPASLLVLAVVLAACGEQRMPVPIHDVLVLDLDHLRTQWASKSNEFQRLLAPDEWQAVREVVEGELQSFEEDPNSVRLVLTPKGRFRYRGPLVDRLEYPHYGAAAGTWSLDADVLDLNFELGEVAEGQSSFRWAFNRQGTGFVTQEPWYYEMHLQFVPRR